jgi:hypothetical protein
MWQLQSRHICNFIVFQPVIQVCVSRAFLLCRPKSNLPEYSDSRVLQHLGDFSEVFICNIFSAPADEMLENRKWQRKLKKELTPPGFVEDRL